MKYEIIDGFLSDWECAELIDMACGRLKSSTTLNPVTGAVEKNDFRSSDQMHFSKGENELISNIENRIAEKTQTSVENGEGIQVVRYSEGGHFNAHYDDFDPNY